MPLRDFKCQNCGAVQERYYRVIDGEIHQPSCFQEECGEAGVLEMMPLSAAISKTAIFPYVTTHVDGKGTPITVESIGHLRALEKRYGVCFSGFNNNDSNPDTPRDLPTMRPGGREYEGPRPRWMEK